MADLRGEKQPISCRVGQSERWSSRCGEWIAAVFTPPYRCYDLQLASQNLGSLAKMHSHWRTNPKRNRAVAELRRKTLLVEQLRSLRKTVRMFLSAFENSLMEVA